MTAGPARERLEACLTGLGPVAVAVSGGVDSMTLAVVAHRAASWVTVFHAVSAAVPTSATERVRLYAEREGWDLAVIDAGEFSDDMYLANPVDRCFHCKRNLYGAMSVHTDAVIVSGTNLDDLHDYRPGLQAAAEASVVHPYVDAGLDKAAVRRLAVDLGLDDLAELPASPCLSSRIETGIPIQPRWLNVIEAVEEELRGELSPDTLRCRLRGDRVVIELDGSTLERLSSSARSRLAGVVATAWAGVGLEVAVEFEQYRMGSMFVRAPR